MSDSTLAELIRFCRLIIVVGILGGSAMQVAEEFSSLALLRAQYDLHLQEEARVRALLERAAGEGEKL